MAFYDDDIDEDLLVEIPCEFCNDPFPILYLTEHQTGCRYDLGRVNEPTVAEVEQEFAAQDVEDNTPTIAEIEEEFAARSIENEPPQDYTELFEYANQLLNSRFVSQPNENKTESPTKESPTKESPTKESPTKKKPNLLERFLQYLHTPLEAKNQSPPKEKVPVVKESPKKTQIEKDFLEYEVLEEDLLEDYETITVGSKHKEKRVDEKPSFKVANIPILDNSDSKSFNRNDLPDSDNEDTESLEQYWEKAKIILTQRLRAIEEKKSNK